MAIKNARDVINGTGYNLGGDTSNANRAAAMQFAGSRWMRVEIDGGEGFAPAMSAAMVTAGYNNPNLKAQILANGYLAQATTYPWTKIQSPLILSYVAGSTVGGNNWTGDNGQSIVWAVEGPNEMDEDDYSGGHTANGEQGVIIDTTTPINNNDQGGGTLDVNSNAAFIQWTAGMYKTLQPTLKNNAIEFISPTILYYSQDNWANSNLNVSQYCDYGTYHRYVTYPPGNPQFGGESLKTALQWAAGAIMGSPTSGMVMSEGPIYQPGELQDQTTIARNALLALVEFHANPGGHRLMYFELVLDLTNTNGATYGFGVVMDSDGVTPFAAGYCLHNFMNLLSLGKNYNSAANAAEQGVKKGQSFPAFTPAYTGAGFSVTGVTNVGDSGTSLIMPKSDGSTMIAVWNDPNTNVSNGSVPANTVTVNFGSSQSYNVYDISGSGGSATMTPASSTTPYLTGTASSVSINLYGLPVLIELVGVTVTQAPPTPTGVAVSSTSATSATISWTPATQGANNTPATYNLQIQQSVNTGTWTTVATNVSGAASSYTFLGLAPSTVYYYRLSATNVIGTSAASASVNSTTLANQTTTTPAFVQAIWVKVDNQPAGTNAVLNLPNAPGPANSFYVFFNGYSNSGSNNTAITAPSGSTVILQNQVNTQECMWAWQVPYTSSGTWTFSGFDSTNNAHFRIIEVSNGVSYDANQGPVSTATATAIGWPLVAPASTNCVRFTTLSIQFTATTIGAASFSPGVITAGTDPASVTYHQGVLLQETPTTASPVSLAITGGTVNDTDAYLSLNIYGNTLPAQVTGVTASGLTNTSVSLSWSAVTGATSYSVETSQDGGSTWTSGLTAITILPSSTNTTITSLSAITPYQFRILANNNSGQGNPSAVVPITTLAQPALTYIQSAIVTDQSGISSITVSFTNNTTVGNTLVFWVTMELSTTNTGLTPPVTVSSPNVQVLPGSVSGTSQVGSMMMWTQTVATPAKSYSFTGYTGTATLMAVEVQGVSSIQTPTSNAAVTYTATSVSLPVTVPNSTPGIGFYGVNMQYNPDSWGGFPSNVTNRQAITGNSATPTNQFHCGLLVQVGSSVATGNQSLPYTLGNGETQGTDAPSGTTAFNPMMIGVNLLGATTAIKPNDWPTNTPLVFGTATTTTQPLSWSAPGGTVTSYQIAYSTSPNMT